MLISIIVPVYKVEEYIYDCINSIINQTYKNFELILVDDGSPDKCPQICDLYSQNYNFIKTIHKINGGLSDARNEGVKVAKGDYITFIDSDDYVSADYLEELVRNLIICNADISTVDCNLTYKTEFKPKSKGHKFIYNGKTALVNMLYQNHMDTHAWGLLIKKELVERFPFPVGKYHEDEFTTYKYYAHAEIVVVSTCKLYYYRQRKDSIMHANNKSYIDELEAADNLVYECEKKWNFALNAAKSKKFSDYCQVYLIVCKSKIKNKKLLLHIKNEINILKFDIIKDCNVRKKNKYAAVILIGGYGFFRIISHIKCRLGW